jgi:hypothetical protein
MNYLDWLRNGSEFHRATPVRGGRVFSIVPANDTPECHVEFDGIVETASVQSTQNGIQSSPIGNICTAVTNTILQSLYRMNEKPPGVNRAASNEMAPPPPEYGAKFVHGGYAPGEGVHPPEVQHGCNGTAITNRPA